MPGKTNNAADAASRYPVHGTEVSSITHCDQEEFLISAAISNEAQDITSISWDLLASETEKDQTLSKLIMAINSNFQGCTVGIEDYIKYKESLYVTNGVVLYQDRVVVPSSLRRAILSKLHSAHQGVSAMLARSQAIIFWPGMTFDIQEIRSKCSECNRNAPSNAPTPSVPATPPLTPFEQIFADFF